MIQSSFAKKTKTEILEEYDKLLEKYEELKSDSNILSDSSSQTLFEKAKSWTSDSFAKSLSDLRIAFHDTLNQLSDKMQTETQKLNEIQQAIELSKKNLQIHYGVQVVADTLQNLIAENENKKKEYEKELVSKKMAAEEEVSKVKKEWAREQEEYEYNAKTKRNRDEETYQAIKTKHEEEMASKSEEIQKMREQAENFPRELENAKKQKEQEVTKILRLEFDTKNGSMKKDWEAEKNIFELTIKNLEETAKKQISEVASWRVEAEKAAKKAQELAIKIVESGVKASPKTDAEKIESKV
ncbi:MAG: hypothetical protein US74_C0010G0001 [Parcubacteria group bacterium GW2011_GWA2_38_13]|nr:MAG: hypothetical protein US74_C0010G0001 [Parcubacteria group bacterium GW2011_GWA2_38_13]